MLMIHLSDGLLYSIREAKRKRKRKREFPVEISTKVCQLNISYVYIACTYLIYLFLIKVFFFGIC